MHFLPLCGFEKRWAPQKTIDDSSQKYGPMEIEDLKNVEEIETSYEDKETLETKLKKISYDTEDNFKIFRWWTNWLLSECFENF